MAETESNGAGGTTEQPPRPYWRRRQRGRHRPRREVVGPPAPWPQKDLVVGKRERSCGWCYWCGRMVTRRRVGGSSALLDEKSVSTCCADFLRGCADKTRTLIELQYRRGDGSICGRNANQPSKSNQVTKDQSPEQLVAQPRRRGVVRVEMNQKIQSKVGKAPRYRRKMRRMHWQPSTQRQATKA